MILIIKKSWQKYIGLPIQLRAAIWFMICSFCQKGISVITTPIFTRLLTTAEYGQYDVFNSWLSILTVFITLSLIYGVYPQGLVKFEGERKVYTSSLQGLTLTMVVCWTIIYLLFYKFWNMLFSLSTVQMLAMLVMIWSSTVFGFWAGEKRVDFQYRKLVVLSIIMSIAKPTVGILFVIFAHDKVTARILALALVELIGYAGLFVVQMRRGKVFFSKRFWQYAINFNLPLIPHYLSQTVLNGADRIMIKYFVGSSAAGIYGLAYSISQVMRLFNSSLGQTLSPWEYQKIKEKKTAELAKVIYPSLIVIAAANIILIAFAPELVAFFAPESYRDAIYVIPPVAMAVYYMFAYDRFAKIAFYFEKTRLIALATVAGAVLNVFLNYIFICKYGYYAAAYTTLVCYVAYAMFHYVIMRKICREKNGGQYPFDTRILAMISFLFMALGFIYLSLYRFIVMRYSLTILLLIAAIISRRRIFFYIRQILSVKKK